MNNAPAPVSFAQALKNAWLWGLAALAFVGLTFGQPPCPAIVLETALIGARGGQLWSQLFKAGGGRQRLAALALAGLSP